MNVFWQEKQALYFELFCLLFPQSNVRLSGHCRIMMVCPLCEHKKKLLSADVSTESLRCYSCGFSACPIDLFVDAYSPEPNGLLLEEVEKAVGPVIEVKKRFIRPDFEPF